MAAQAHLCGLLLVDLGAWLLDLTQNMSHAGLVAHEGGQVWRLARIILGERLDLALAPPGPLLGQEAQGTAPRVCALYVS